MSDLVGNPEDRFSHNDAQIASPRERTSPKTTCMTSKRKTGQIFSQLLFHLRIVFGFEDGTLVLIASVPGHCVSFTFYV